MLGNRMSAYIPWKDLMAFGFGILQLSSDQFWSMTLRELEAALTAGSQRPNSDHTSRSMLDEMITSYPDDCKRSIS